MIQNALDKRYEEKQTLYKIDLKVLFTPEHEDFLKHYAFEDEDKDDLIQKI